MSIRVAIAGYGNIGKMAIKAVQDAPDMVLAGVVRRTAQPVDEGIRVVTHPEDLGGVDVALLCLPSRETPDAAIQYLQKGIHTVDSFDIHGEIPQVRARLDDVARKSNAVSILSAGWDPGSDSVLRALLMACAPKGITHTNFGPGMSMGHSVAVRNIRGVRDGISITIPAGESRHRRMVYVELESGVRLEEVTAAIKADPYFVHDETHVQRVDDVESLRNMAHGVELTRNGISADAHNQQFSFTMRVNNPALTAQMMVSCARAAKRQRPGCYTMIELPTVDLLPGDRDAWIGRLV